MARKLIPMELRGWVFRPEKEAEDFVRITFDAEAVSIHRVADLSQATFTRKPSAMLISLICAHFPEAFPPTIDASAMRIGPYISLNQCSLSTGLEHRQPGVIVSRQMNPRAV